MHYEEENCVTTKGRKEHTRKRPLESQQSAAAYKQPTLLNVGKPPANPS